MSSCATHSEAKAAPRRRTAAEPTVQPKTRAILTLLREKTEWRYGDLLAAIMGQKGDCENPRLREAARYAASRAICRARAQLKLVDPTLEIVNLRRGGEWWIRLERRREDA